MSRDRFDVLERFTPLFEAPERSFEGFLRRRDRKRRNQRITAGVVGIAVFAAAVWIVTTGGPFDRTQTPTAPGPTVAPDDADRVGLIGLPPEGTTPSTPERGELVLGFTFLYGHGDAGRFSGSLYADGRLIWWRLGPPENPPGVEQRGHLERRLTPEGVELVRAEVISTALFDHDVHFVNAHGLYSGQIEVRNGDRLVRVTWGDCCDPGSADEAREMPTPEQASALQRLDARLADPASWLPASAWEDPEIKAYVPSRYYVCYGAQQGIGLSRVLASLPRPAEDLLRTWGRTQSEYGGPSPETTFDIWCSHVTTEEARALAQILEDAGIQERDFGDELAYEVQSRDPSDGMDVTVSFGPLLPDEA